MKFIVANAISLHSDKWEIYALSSAGADASMKCIGAHWLLIKCYGIEIVNVTLHIALIVVVIVVVVVVAGCHCNCVAVIMIFLGQRPTMHTEWRRGVRQKPQRQYSLSERHKSKPTHCVWPQEIPCDCARSSCRMADTKNRSQPGQMSPGRSDDKAKEYTTSSSATITGPAE